MGRGGTLSQPLRTLLGMRRMRPRVELAREIDEELARDALDAFRSFEGRWSGSVREALGMATVDLAQRMKISQPSVARMERREAEGGISLGALSSVAEALGCELVYGFVPRQPLAATAACFERRQAEARSAKRKMPRNV